MFSGTPLAFLFMTGAAANAVKSLFLNDIQGFSLILDRFGELWQVLGKNKKNPFILTAFVKKAIKYPF